MARNARKLVTADGVVVNRAGKLKAVIPATTGTGSVIFYNGANNAAPEIYRLVAGTGVHINLELNFTKLFADVTGAVSLNVLYE